MSEDRFCERCGAVIHDGDEYFDFNGEDYCEECYHRDTFSCSCCGTRILWEDNAGDENTPLCRSCFEENYTICQDCGRVIRRDEANYPEGCDEDDDDDEAYCNSCFDHLSIHDYYYKPSPKFYGNGERFFGVELEIDTAGEYSENADKLLEIGNFGTELMYIKHDGSLDCGMEIVTHPMTLEFHKTEMPWLEIMNEALEMRYLSHKTNTCGLHVHVNRTTFGNTREAQEDAISRVLYFVEHHWNELLKFSRRTEKQMEWWAARYGYKNCPKDILDHAKNVCDSRYTCVNITNYETVEFRMFRGTLKYNTLIATLELVDKICDIAVNLSDSELQKLSWSEFVMSLDNVEHRELIEYLKERRLYVNEPICGEEDM